MVVEVHERSDLELKQTINVKNAKFFKKGFTTGSVICSTDCSNDSFGCTKYMLLMFVGYVELHPTLQYVRYG